MRVAHIYRDYLADGGMPRETRELARSMEPFVEKLFVYCQHGSDETAIEDGRVTIRSFPANRSRMHSATLRLPQELVRTILTNADALDVAVITGAFIPEHTAVSRLLQRAGIPYVVSVGAGLNPFLMHGIRGAKKRAYLVALERRVLESATALRVYSDVNAQHIARWIGRVEGRAFVAKEGVDWETLRAELPDYDGLLEKSLAMDIGSAPAYGFLGRLTVYTKGLDYLLHAWRVYRDHGGRGRLVLRGPATDHDMRALRRMQRTLGLRDVEILGPLYGRQKYEFLAKLSALVHPSRHEGIPRVLREALALACPVIVSRNTNIHDVVDEWRAGAVTELDEEKLAEGMLALDALPLGEQRDMRARAVAAARSLDWRAIGEAYATELNVRVGALR